MIDTNLNNIYTKDSIILKVFHSVRKLFTGLAKEALIDWKLMVTNVIAMTTIPARIKILSYKC